jgi:hypothetical protein
MFIFKLSPQKCAKVLIVIVNFSSKLFFSPKRERERSEDGMKDLIKRKTSYLKGARKQSSSFHRFISFTRKVLSLSLAQEQTFEQRILLSSLLSSIINYTANFQQNSIRQFAFTRLIEMPNASEREAKRRDSSKIVLSTSGARDG